VFQERLYCIRWAKTVTRNGRPKLERRFAAPDAADLAREAQVIALLRERFAEWQIEGFIPSKAIPVGGDKTEEPIRTRGWTHWHQLFTPRQLLTYGCYLSHGTVAASKEARVALLLKLGVQANWNSKLCTWNGDKSKGPGNTDQTFVNQALNPLFNHGNKSFGLLQDSLLKPFGETSRFAIQHSTQLIDAREIDHECDIWITDPPYADAINYHELGDFFFIVVRQADY
jgi:adenine-specific DNA methylase